MLQVLLLISSPKKYKKVKNEIPALLMTKREREDDAMNN